MKKNLSLYSTLGAVMFLSMSVSNTASASGSFRFESPKKVRYGGNLIEGLINANRKCHAQRVHKEKVLTTENKKLTAQSEMLTEGLIAAIEEKEIESTRRRLGDQMRDVVGNWLKTVLIDAQKHYGDKDKYLGIVNNLNTYKLSLDDSVVDAEEREKPEIKQKVKNVIEDVFNKPEIKQLLKNVTEDVSNKSEKEELLKNVTEDVSNKSEKEELMNKVTEEVRKNKELMVYLDNILLALESQCKEYNVEKAEEDLIKKQSDAQKLSEQKNDDQNLGETQGGAQVAANDLFNE